MSSSEDTVLKLSDHPSYNCVFKDPLVSESVQQEGRENFACSVPFQYFGNGGRVL